MQDTIYQFEHRQGVVLKIDEDSRQLAEAHGSAELRLINGAGHRLRHDPRAIAVLLGWLDRQRTLDA